MASEENSLSRVEKELLINAARIEVNASELTAVRKEVEEKNVIITNSEQAFKRNHLIVEQNQNRVDECNRKLAYLLEKHDVGFLLFSLNFLLSNTDHVLESLIPF